MSPYRNILIIIVVLAVFVLGASYLLFSASDVPVPAAADLEQDTTSVAAAERRFLALIASLEPTHLNTSLLSNPRFTALIDFRVAVSVPPAGRQNPFAPLSAQ